MPTFGLSATQLVATGLAGTTATFAASYLGVAGTVVGAALASVLTATGNAVYGQTLRRTRDRVLVAVPVRRSTRTMRIPTIRDDEAPVLPSPAPVATTQWRRIAIGALGSFVVLMAVVTSVELVAGRPVSDLARGDSGGGTTFFGHQTVRTTAPATPAPTVFVTVTPKVVVTTPTVIRTAPARTTTVTPTSTVTSTPTQAPSNNSSGTATGSPSASQSPAP